MNGQELTAVWLAEGQGRKDEIMKDLAGGTRVEGGFLEARQFQILIKHEHVYVLMYLM